MRGKDEGGLFFGDGGDDFINRCRCPRGLCALAGLAGLQDCGRRGNVAHVEDLRPAVAKPAIADHHDMFAGGKLAGDGLHAVGAAAGHQHGGMRAVDFFQDAGDVSHHALEVFRHVVERAVGVNHRKLKQAVRVNIGKESGHGVSRSLCKSRAGSLAWAGVLGLLLGSCGFTRGCLLWAGFQLPGSGMDCGSSPQ